MTKHCFSISDDFGIIKVLRYGVNEFGNINSSVQSLLKDKFIFRTRYIEHHGFILNQIETDKEVI